MTVYAFGIHLYQNKEKEKKRKFSILINEILKSRFVGTKQIFLNIFRKFKKGCV